MKTDLRAPRPCHQRPLFQNSVCRLTQCSHGTVHLTTGALTLRLTPHQLAELSAALDAATRMVVEPEEERPRLLC